MGGVFDPSEIEPVEVGGCMLRQKDSGSVYVETEDGNSVKVNLRQISYDPDIPMEVYLHLVTELGGSIPTYGFVTPFLQGNINQLERATSIVNGLDRSFKWQYAKIKGVEYVIGGAGKKQFVIKDGDEVTVSNHYGLPPAKHLLAMAIGMGFPLDKSARLTILGCMSPAAAEKLAPKLKRLSSRLSKKRSSTA